MCRGHAQRRRYALLEGGSGVMLVHYLARATAPRTPVPDSTESDETVRAQMHGHSSSVSVGTCGGACVFVSGCRSWQAAESASGELLTVGLRGLLGHALAGACA